LHGQTLWDRGEFAALPGLGRPHPIIDEPYDPHGWFRRKLAAEGLGERKSATAD